MEFNLRAAWFSELSVGKTVCLGIHFHILVSTQPIFVWQPSCFDSGSVLINWWPIHVWWAVWYGVRVHWIAKGTGWQWCCCWHCYMAVGSCLSFFNKQYVVRLALFVWLGWGVDLLEELVLLTLWRHVLSYLMASLWLSDHSLLMQHLICLSPPIHHTWEPQIFDPDMGKWRLKRLWGEVETSTYL